MLRTVALFSVPILLSSCVNNAKEPVIPSCDVNNSNCIIVEGRAASHYDSIYCSGTFTDSRSPYFIDSNINVEEGETLEEDEEPL